MLLDGDYIPLLASSKQRLLDITFQRLQGQIRTGINREQICSLLEATFLMQSKHKKAPVMIVNVMRNEIKCVIILR